MPQSFHQNTIWTDSFSCLISANNPILKDFTLDTYLEAQHVWVSKTGMGVGVGVDPEDVQRLGWVDAAIAKLGKKRNITVFTRHYGAAMILAEQNDLVVTLPSLAAELQHDNPALVIKTPPFEIPPIELKLAWSPLLQHNPANRWLRQLIVETGREVSWEH
jgi:DNA-binding transcriptional LysR family regulator